MVRKSSHDCVSLCTSSLPPSHLFRLIFDEWAFSSKKLATRTIPRLPNRANCDRRANGTLRIIRFSYDNSPPAHSSSYSRSRFRIVVSNLGCSNTQIFEWHRRPRWHAQIRRSRASPRVFDSEDRASEEMRALKIPYLTFSLGYSKKKSFHSISHFTVSAVIRASELQSGPPPRKIARFEMFARVLRGLPKFVPRYSWKVSVKERKIFTTRLVLAVSHVSSPASRFDAAIKSP